MSEYRELDFLSIDSKEDLMSEIEDELLFNDDNVNLAEPAFLLKYRNFKDLRIRFLIVVTLNNLITGVDDVTTYYSKFGFWDLYQVIYARITGEDSPVKDYDRITHLLEDACILIRDEPYRYIPSEWHPYVCDSMIKYNPGPLEYRPISYLDDEESEEYNSFTFPLEFIDSVSSYLSDFIREHNLS